MGVTKDKRKRSPTTCSSKTSLLRSDSPPQIMVLIREEGVHINEPENQVVLYTPQHMNSS